MPDNLNELEELTMFSCKNRKIIGSHFGYPDDDEDE